MTQLGFAANSFDLIWCEGAAYIMGVARALAYWKRFLKPGGKIAFTECVFFSSDPPKPILNWWQGHYPEMV